MDNDYDGDGVPDDEDDDDDNDGIPDDLKYDDFISGEDEGNYGTRDSEVIDLRSNYLMVNKAVEYYLCIIFIRLCAFFMIKYHSFFFN